MITLLGNPISTNHCYQNMRVNLRILTREARALREDYQWQAIQQWKKKPVLREPFSVSIKIYFGSKRKCDWDNFHKLSMDALNGIVWADDSLIRKALVEKLYDKEFPRIEITTYEF